LVTLRRGEEFEGYSEGAVGLVEEGDSAQI